MALLKSLTTLSKFLTDPLELSIQSYLTIKTVVLFFFFFYNLYAYFPFSAFFALAMTLLNKSGGGHHCL